MHYGEILAPKAKRAVVAVMREQTVISERRACRLVGLSCTILHYRHQVCAENDVLITWITALAPTSSLAMKPTISSPGVLAPTDATAAVAPIRHRRVRPGSVFLESARASVISEYIIIAN